MRKKISKPKSAPAAPARPRVADRRVRGFWPGSRRPLLEEQPIAKGAGSIEDVRKQEAEVEFRAESEYGLIRESVESQLLPLMVSVTPADIEGVDSSSGMDLVVLVDTSGSMLGQKMKLVKDTLRFVVQEMRETDRVALVAFNGSASNLAGLSPMTDSNKKDFQNLIQPSASNFRPG